VCRPFYAVRAIGQNDHSGPIGALRHRAFEVAGRITTLAPEQRLRIALASDAIERFAAGRTISVLEAGCGAAPLARRLARAHPGWRITGLDSVEGAIEHALELAVGEGLDAVELDVADLTVPLPSEFDAIACVDVLTEVPDDRAMMAALAGALAPGGLLVVTVMDRDWKPALRGSTATWKDEVRHGYTRAELAALAEQAGLAVQRIKPVYRIAVRLAEEINDRLRSRRLRYRAPVYPLLVAAAGLERRGLAFGRSHGWLLEARTR
jgi:SAM-dependent methyltransferase